MSLQIPVVDVSAKALSVRDQTVNADLLFIEAWDKGRVSWSIAATSMLRVRQIRRANPGPIPLV